LCMRAPHLLSSLLILSHQFRFTKLTSRQIVSMMGRRMKTKGDIRSAWASYANPSFERVFSSLGLRLSIIVSRCAIRGNIEVTFEEVRAHLGLETQRQWSMLAIARTSPCPARDCLASWCSWPMLCILTICQHAKLPGIPKPNPPLSMRWP
jgi:hypothetical protein